jgi:hypothetical protein
MLTMKKVNDAIQRLEDGWELVKGNGYFYWAHPTDTSYTDLETVDVYRLNHLDLEQWIYQFTHRKPSYGTLAYREWELEQEKYA